MKKGRFTEEQIIGILRAQEAGAATADVCRKHGISSAIFYKWKAKFGGLEVSDAKRLKALERVGLPRSGEADSFLVRKRSAYSVLDRGPYKSGDGAEHLTIATP